MRKIRIGALDALNIPAAGYKAMLRHGFDILEIQATEKDIPCHVSIDLLTYGDDRPWKWIPFYFLLSGTPGRGKPFRVTVEGARKLAWTIRSAVFMGLPLEEAVRFGRVSPEVLMSILDDEDSIPDGDCIFE